MTPSYEEITQRNIGVVTPEEQARIRSLCVAIAGCGAFGAPTAHYLARLGVGELRLADPEEFEASNINRQFAAYVDTIGVNKAEAVAAELARINPEVAVRTFTDGVCQSSIAGLLDGADVVVDGLDFFELEARDPPAPRGGPARAVDLRLPGSRRDHNGDLLRPVAAGP